MMFPTPGGRHEANTAYKMLPQKQIDWVDIKQKCLLEDFFLSGLSACTISNCLSVFNGMH